MRKLLAAGLLVGLLLAAGIWWATQETPASDPVPASAASALEVATQVAPEASAPTPAKPKATATAQVDPLEAKRERRRRSREFHEEQRKRWEAYPRNSRPLAAGRQDPVKAAHTPTPSRSGGPDRVAPFLIVQATTLHVQPGQTSEIQAWFEGESGVLPARDMQLAVARAREEEEPLRMTRGDDNRYTARYTPTPEDRGAVTIRARGVAKSGESRLAAVGIVVSQPGATLTGRFEDRIDKGDLLITAELDVKTAGRFHLEGTLYDAQSHPVGWAQKAEKLEPGRGEITLRYAGLMFHEADAPGPYTLRFASLRTTGQVPGDLAPLVENGHVTAPYPVEDFAGKTP